MRYAARIDANHNDIANALRAAFYSVYDASRVGGGFPDLIVAARGRTVLVEIKDGSKEPARRRLRKSQEDFRDGWRGAFITVYDVDDALQKVERAIRNQLPEYI